MALSTFLSFQRVLLLLLFISSFVTATSNNSQLLPAEHQQCFHEHFSALIRLKRGFRFDPYYSNTDLSTWNPDNRDCCAWEGIMCNGVTAHVTHLDLGEFYISGQIDFESIFSIRSLKKLSLAYNYFDPSPIPSGISQLTSLMHLNLSNANFYGKIPSAIGSLTSLVSLDLSCSPLVSYHLDDDGFLANSCKWKLESTSIGRLVQNLSSLRELHLSWAKFSPEGSEWSRALALSLPHLRKLNLRGCGLLGPIHSSSSELHFLSQLDLSYNSLSSAVFDYVGNFSSLTSLELRSCQLHGLVPRNILMLPVLQTLDLSGNSLVGSSLEFPSNSTLQYLDLSGMQLSGGFPDSLKNLNLLTGLVLSDCSMSGPLPSWLVNLTRLEILQLSQNYFNGPIPSSYGSELLNLRIIEISENQISGSIPSSLLSLPLLEALALAVNHLGGELGEFQNASSSNLEVLLFGDNNLQGNIPRSMFELRKLTIIYLSLNNFSGVLDLGLFGNLKELIHLELSDNRLSVEDSGGNLPIASFPQLSMLNMRSCNINKFPSVLRNQEALTYIDLSKNRIKGEIPNWTWEVGRGRLIYLNLSHNVLHGIEPPFPHVSLKRLRVLDLSSNLIKGSLISSSTFHSSRCNNCYQREVPMSICNSTFLEVLDVSSNLFSGQVPPCLGETSNFLSILNLRRNNFSGKLLQKFKEGCNLKTIDVSSNKLEGQVPRSLTNCKKLEVINLGSNQIHDSFPFWLGNLSQLRVLVLRSNKLYGSIVDPLTNPTFTMLQIMDLSSNDFTGSLPFNMFRSWKAMMKQSNSGPYTFLNRSFDWDGYYQDEVTITSKGLEMELVKILNAFTVLDLSNNKFHGSIPSSTGDLKSLHVLNMSYNDFEGGLPASLGDVRELESLDLSHNRLSGEIPWQLTKLTFLSVLDLSQNLLEGSIPHSQQFLTFPKESFLGNLGLCGFPLSTKCEDVPPSLLPSEQSDSEFDWDSIWIGLAVGFGVGWGSLFWTLALWRNGRKLFYTFADRMLSKIFPCAVCCGS